MTTDNNNDDDSIIIDDTNHNTINNHVVDIDNHHNNNTTNLPLSIDKAIINHSIEGKTTWEQRIQHEIDTTKQIIEQIVLQNVPPTNNVVNNENVIHNNNEKTNNTDGLTHKLLEASLDQHTKNDFMTHSQLSVQPYTSSQHPLPTTTPDNKPLTSRIDDVQSTFDNNQNNINKGSLPETSTNHHHHNHYKRHRTKHLVIENDDTGEGLNIITITDISVSSSTTTAHTTTSTTCSNSNMVKKKKDYFHRRRRSESFNNSLLDDEDEQLSTHSDRNKRITTIINDNDKETNTIKEEKSKSSIIDNNNHNQQQKQNLTTKATATLASPPMNAIKEFDVAHNSEISNVQISDINVIEDNKDDSDLQNRSSTILEEKKDSEFDVITIPNGSTINYITNTTHTPNSTTIVELQQEEITNDNIENINDNNDSELRDCLSATESEVASLDGLPSTLQHRLLLLDTTVTTTTTTPTTATTNNTSTTSREHILQSLDGIFSKPKEQQQQQQQQTRKTHHIINTSLSNVETTPIVHNTRQTSIDVTYERDARFQSRQDGREGRRIHQNHHEQQKYVMRYADDNDKNDNTTSASCGGIFLEACTNFTKLWNDSNNNIMDDDRLKCGSKGQWDTSTMKQNLEIPLAILDCSNIINQEERISPHLAPRVHSSFVRVAREYHNNNNNDINPSYADTILPTEVDPRMQDWIINQYNYKDKAPNDGTYQLGQSRTVIVHEIHRDHWTWCTKWSRDGKYLAIATDNHQLAIIDTLSSTVWRVQHDHKIGNNTTAVRSIRTIDWGTNYIAIGGTGNVVSILCTMAPYDVLHNIPATGFVGCVQWRCNSNVLAIGSRLDFVLIVRIVESHDQSILHGGKQIHNEILHKIEYKFWVNCVKFSADGSCIAVGDAGGIVSVYDYEESEDKAETHMITWFKRKDSILNIEWSPDGKWLYAGGEDCSVTVVDTAYWEIVHRIGQDRWVQCISSSHSGSHVAIGGVSSEISILDVENGWDSVMGIELKGLVPLSAEWHPRDQYLVLTGQDNTVLIVETTNARHVKGHHLYSISPIRAIEFSPDGRMVVVGNEAGVVTFFSLSGTSFITAYELVIPLSKNVCIKWSLNGMFVVIGSSNQVIVVSRKRNKRQGQKCPPNASGFSVKKVINDAGTVHAISIDYQSQYVAVSGDCTRILDVRDDFSIVQEWKSGPYYANAWSPVGRWLAMMGKDKFLTIYDTSSKRVDRWRVIFSMKCDFTGSALAWGPLIVGGLLYLAYGGDSNEIYIMEIRTLEGTWETVLKIKRDESINALDWSIEGLLAAGVGNGTVCIVDLSYLQTGIAVNEMDYEWQRQALTCFTEIRRNRGINSIKSLRWLPAAPGSDRLLAVGGTDGEVEIIDLTERQRCKGYTS
jgi:WD40 repeat protein